MAKIGAVSALLAALALSAVNLSQEMSELDKPGEPPQ